MRLEPDFQLLESIGILSDSFLPYLPGGRYQMEVEEKDFKSLSPFLIRWGAGEALQELFFFQVNFIKVSQPPKPHTLQAIQEQRTYFQSREKLGKMDFSQIKGIKLHFGKDSIGNGINADLPPDLVDYFGKWIKKELEAEQPAGTTPTEFLKSIKELENHLQNSKLKIQNELLRVEAILKAKSPEATFTRKQIILCTYGIFYQRGHRLNFEDHKGTEPESPEAEFQHVAVYDLIKSHLPKELL